MSLEENLVLAVGILIGTTILFGLFCVILIPESVKGLLEE